MLLACDNTINENPDGYDEYRIIAWEYLGAENNSNYIGTWRDGHVSESFNPLTELPALFVRFDHKYDNLNGPYGVYIDKETKEVVYRPIGE